MTSFPYMILIFQAQSTFFIQHQGNRHYCKENIEKAIKIQIVFRLDYFFISIIISNLMSKKNPNNLKLKEEQESHNGILENDEKVQDLPASPEQAFKGNASQLNEELARKKNDRNQRRSTVGVRLQHLPQENPHKVDYRLQIPQQNGQNTGKMNQTNSSKTGRIRRGSQDTLMSQKQQEGKVIWRPSQKYSEQEEDMENSSKQDEEAKKKQRNNKKIFFIAIGILAAAILAGLIFTIVHVTRQTISIPLKNTVLIVTPAYNVGKCYVTNETITTYLMGSNETQIIQNNYTCIFVVVDKNKTNTLFSSVCQKISEQTFNEEMVPTGEPKSFEPSPSYYQILKTGKASQIDQNETEQEFDYGDINFNSSQYIESEDGSSPNGTGFIETPAILPVFRFSLLMNGKIDFMTFPKEMEKSTVALLKSFVKLFSPLLEQKLYEGKESVSKVKRTPMRKVKAKNYLFNDLSQNQGNNSAGSNETQGEEGTLNYSEETNYTSEASEQNVTLINQGHIQSSGNTHSTVEDTYQQNFFSENEPTGANSMSYSEFVTPQNNAGQNEQTFDLALNMSSRQEATMEFIEIFLSRSSYIQRFDSILKVYEDVDDTYTMTMQQLVYYVMDSEDIETENGTTRLLLNPDGSLTIINYDKDVRILSTNVIGFAIALYGYTEVNLKLYEDPTNQHKKIPRMFSEIGTKLVLGSSQKKLKISDYNKQFPPLTLKFTLQKIQNVVNLIKGDFIQKIIEIADLIKTGDFVDNLVPNLLNVASMISEVHQAVVDKEIENSPVSILNQIFQYAEEISQILRTNGEYLLDPKSQFKALLVSQLSEFRESRFAESLSIFLQSQSNLEDIKNHGQDYLEDLFGTVTAAQDYNQLLDEMNALVPADVQEEYQRMIEISSQIFQFLDYVKNNGLDYANVLESLVGGNRADLLNFLKGVADLYFNNQTALTNIFKNQIEQRIEIVSSQVSNLHYLATTINTDAMEERIRTSFQALQDQTLKNLSLAFRGKLQSQIQALESSATSAGSEAVQCCAWGRTCCSRFLGICTDRCDVCQQYNAGRAEQQNLLNLFRTNLKETLSTLPTSIDNEISNFTTGVVSILTDNSIGTVERFSRLMGKYNHLKYESDVEMNLQSLVSSLEGLITYCTGMLTRVCGARTNSEAFKNKLETLKAQVVQIQNRYASFLNINNLGFGTFNPDAYVAILNDFFVEDETDIFSNIYHEYEDHTVQIINSLRSFTIAYDINNFFASYSNSIQYIRSFYQNISNSFNQLCLKKQQHIERIAQIRNIYLQKFNQVMAMNGGLISNQLGQLRNFLNISSTQLFQTILDADICEDKQNFDEQIEKILRELQKFVVLSQLYDGFQAIKAESQERISEIKNNISDLRENFLLLFTPEGYRNFITFAKNQSEILKEVVLDTSIKLSELKEQAREIGIFQVAPLDDLLQNLEILTNSTFDLSPGEMFAQLEDLEGAALDIIDLLSFDIIAIVVAANEVSGYLQRMVENFEVGIGYVNGNFSSLCDAFIDLDEGVTQSYLNQIFDGFRNLTASVNDTLFPNIVSDLRQIQDNFQNVSFNSNRIQSLFDNAMNKLVDAADFLEQTKNYTFASIDAYLSEAMDIIDILEIGSLNSLYDLAVVIEEEFSQFISEFPDILSQLFSFRTLVNNNFREVFNFPQILQNIESMIEEKYEQRIGRILQKLNQTDQDLSHNSNFYRVFKDSEAYASIQNASEQFILPFQNLWSFADEKKEALLEKLSEIGEGLEELLSELSDAKNVLQDVEQSVKNRIQTIKSQFQAAVRIFTNLQSLIFTALREDLGGTVMRAVNNITGEIDAIVEQDIGAIRSVAEDTFNGSLSFLATTVQTIMDGYAVIKERKGALLEKLQIGTQKIDQFLGDLLSGKMQSLKTALVFINSQSNLDEPVQTLVLINRTLLSEENRAPRNLFKYTQLIPTMIGTFSLHLQLDYAIDLRFLVKLRQFRSVDVSALFEARLIVEIAFSYGIVYLLEFGIYVRGNILRAEVEPIVSFNNVIPIQLVNAIANIPEINQDNVVRITFALDLALHAVELEVGMYIKHIWLELIWIRIRLCFWLFCISFRIPIGFMVVWLRHDFGTTIAGVTLLKKRLFELQILQFQY